MIRILYPLKTASVLLLSSWVADAHGKDFSWTQANLWRESVSSAVVALEGSSSKSCSEKGAEGRSNQEIYENCCLCFTAEEPAEHVKMFRDYCKDWLRSQRSFCSGKSAFILPENAVINSYEMTPELPLSCAKVRIFGAFHGQACDYKKPFEIASRVSKRLLSKEICYDGISCLLFNNTEKLAACAVDIKSRDCEFSISGNQNIFICRAEDKFFGLKQKMVPISESSSKTQVKIPTSGAIVVTHDRCSPAGGRCGYNLFAKEGATNDTLKKSCVFQGKVTQQTCCEEPLETRISVHQGFWSEPGLPCKKKSS